MDKVIPLSLTLAASTAAQGEAWKSRPVTQMIDDTLDDRVDAPRLESSQGHIWVLV